MIFLISPDIAVSDRLLFMLKLVMMCWCVRSVIIWTRVALSSCERYAEVIDECDQYC